MLESINMSLRKVIRTRSLFPTDEAVTRLFYLALNNMSRKWSIPIRDWKAALNRFTIQFEERLVQTITNTARPPRLKPTC
jgi:putative transposase